VKAGEGGSGGWNGAEEKGKEGTQQGREGRKQEGEARGEGEVIEGTDSVTNIAVPLSLHPFKTMDFTEK